MFSLVSICEFHKALNGRHFIGDICQCIVLNEKYEFHLKLHRSYSWDCNGQYINIGSDYDLAPNKRQAIIWTSDGWIIDIYMRHSALMR